MIKKVHNDKNAYWKCPICGQIVNQHHIGCDKCGTAKIGKSQWLLKKDNKYGNGLNI